MLYDYDPDDYSEQHCGYPFSNLPSYYKKSDKRIRFTEIQNPTLGYMKYSFSELIQKKNISFQQQDDIFNLLESNTSSSLSSNKDLIPFYGVKADIFFGLNEYLNPTDGSVFVIEPKKEKINIKFARSFDTLVPNTGIYLRDRHQVEFFLVEEVHRNFSVNKRISNVSIDVSKVSKWGFLELGSNCGNFYPSSLQSQYFHNTNAKVRLFFYKADIVDKQLIHPLINVRTEATQTFVPTYKGQLLSIRVPFDFGLTEPKVEGLKFNSKLFMKEANQYQFVYFVEKNPTKERISFLANDTKNYRCVIGCPVDKPFNKKFHRNMKCGDPIHNSIIELQGVDHLELIFYSSKLPRFGFDKSYLVSGNKTYTKDRSTIEFGIQKPISHILVSRHETDMVKLIPVS